MSSEADSKQIAVSTVGDEHSEQDETKTIASNEPVMASESDHLATADLEPRKPNLVEKLSSLDMGLNHDDDYRSDTGNSDKDSAKAGLDDHDDDRSDTGNSDKDSAKAGLDDHDDDSDDRNLDSDISTARKRHMERLADIYSRMEQASRDHDAAIETTFRAKISSLDSVITHQNLECDKLRELSQQKDDEIAHLRQEMVSEEERHRNELSQQKTSAEEERARAGEQWERELREAMEKRGHEHQQAMEEQQQRHRQAMDEQQSQHEQSLASLREELAKDSEQRVSNLLEEQRREAEQRVSKVRAETERALKADFEREREQTMKETRSEMARLVEREREARERCRRLELQMAQSHTAHTGSSRGGPSSHGRRGGHMQSSRDESPHLRQQPLQSSSSWAIARLWGVGQTRARSFS